MSSDYSIIIKNMIKSSIFFFFDVDKNQLQNIDYEFIKYLQGGEKPDKLLKLIEDEAAILNITSFSDRKKYVGDSLETARSLIQNKKMQIDLVYYDALITTMITLQNEKKDKSLLQREIIDLKIENANKFNQQEGLISQIQAERKKDREKLDEQASQIEEKLENAKRFSEIQVERKKDREKLDEQASQIEEKLENAKRFSEIQVERKKDREKLDEQATQITKLMIQVTQLLEMNKKKTTD